jgi:hypothetical protein
MAALLKKKSIKEACIVNFSTQPDHERRRKKIETFGDSSRSA